jgi:5-formyltetrahydrofolate cyclo-ligase
MPNPKTELRRHLKQARLELAPTGRSANSQTIIKQLKQLINWSTVKSLHYFEPIHDLAEPDISPFIAELKVEYPQLVMVAARGKTPPTEKFEAIIVPMLGFDPKTLHRVGYGGGYYDKFLAGQPTARKIGVCFELGKLDQLPVEAHDVALDLIVTESGVYT